MESSSGLAEARQINRECRSKAFNNTRTNCTKTNTSHSRLRHPQETHKAAKDKQEKAIRKSRWVVVKIILVTIGTTLLLNNPPQITEAQDFDKQVTQQASGEKIAPKAEEPQPAKEKVVAVKPQPKPKPKEAKVNKAATKPKPAAPVKQIASTCASEIKKYDWNHTVAYNVMMAESSGNHLIVNNNPNTGDYSVGCFQINLYGNLRHTRPSESWLKVPANNVAYAYGLYRANGWSPWGFTTCRYKVNCY